MPVFEKISTLPFSRDEVFAWHKQPGALARFTPPWQKLKLVRKIGGLESGSEVEFQMKLGPVWKTWLARHTDYQEGRLFRDIQVKGPFGSWDHQHIFEDASAGCRYVDRIHYNAPLSMNFLSGSIEKELNRAFSYRHQTLLNDLRAAQLAALPHQQRILISGASGLVGQALTAFLTTGGHRVFSLTRRQPSSPSEILWDPEKKFEDVHNLEGFDAVIHLAGENISGSRWTNEVKKRLYSSRIDSTKNLVEALSRTQTRPKTFICASAVGFYGDRADEILTEDSAPGENFLATICKDWEQEARRAEDLNIRSVQMRIGVVLTPAGGALEKMLPPFRVGLGGSLGSGSQYMSWISIDDLIYSIAFALGKTTLSGPVNAVSPEACQFKAFAQALARSLHRPVGPSVPAFALKALAGELAEQLLLASIRVRPQKLLKAGFTFSQPDLDHALTHLLGTTR
jgi:uncharacterized protein (TIGR01777 family)